MKYTLAILLLLGFAAQPAWADMLSIESKIDEGSWKKSKAIYPLKGQKVRLRVTSIAGAKVRWYRIMPNINRLYHNAGWPWDPDAYKWLGYDKIRHEKHELTGGRGQWEIDPLSMDVVRLHDQLKIENGDSPGNFRSDFGSFWFQVEVEANGVVKRSPGIEDGDDRGISPNAFRIAVRDGPGYLGWLTSFMNVPAVFGSTVYQNKNYIGSDCADVLMAAYHQWKGKELNRDYNVQGLVRSTPKVAQFELRAGAPDKQIRWHENIKPGDFIAAKFEGQSFYQHIGALYKDGNGDGILNSEDWVLHAGPLPLHFSQLKEGGFDGTVFILRHK